LREIWDVAWARFNLITVIVGEAQGRVITWLFYFTIMAPFGIASRLLSDPLWQRKTAPEWVDRHPVPNDLEAAKRQG
jgi:hypothetical protein